MAPAKWARLLTDYPCPLRVGAWYRVLSAAALEVVVDVNQKPIRVPRQQLHLAEQPTTLWTIVERAKPSPRTPRSLGTRYVVCPSCRERVALEGRPVNMRCPRCNGLFGIDWTGEKEPARAAAAAPASEGPRLRLSIPTMPRRRGPERRAENRRKSDTPVATESRQGDRRRNTDRRKGAKGPPKDPAA